MHTLCRHTAALNEARLLPLSWGISSCLRPAKKYHFCKLMEKLFYAGLDFGILFVDVSISFSMVLNWSEVQMLSFWLLFAG